VPHKPPASAERSRCAGQDEYTPWHSSPQAWRFIIRRYLPLLAAGNLMWELLQLPLYTLWREGDQGAMLFAVLHCTAGDIMIGIAALLIAIMLFGRYGWPQSRHGRVLGAATFTGMAYTVLSEWVNTEVTMGWEYGEAMVRVPPLGSGITHLLQWLVVPPVAYGLAYAMGMRRAVAKATL
jgi:hypothetical protein